MTMASTPNGQQPAAIAALKTPSDAVLILEGVRRNVMPRVTRRLTGHERQAIRAGTVWAWEEGETCMKRWTDGKRWGASRVGQGGFLLYAESTESHSPPPDHAASFDPRYWPQPQPQKQQTRNGESLIKQTYSTTMIEDGKEKKWHVVAYANKYNPLFDHMGPLPGPQQLPALANIAIDPGRFPDWEQQCSTNEAYSRRPPPGVVTTSPTGTEAKPNASGSLEATPSMVYSSRVSSPPREQQTPQVMPPYASPPYLPRDLQDRRIPMQYSPQPYGTDRHQGYYDGRQFGRSTYPPPNGPYGPNAGLGPESSHPGDPYYSARRERSPPRESHNGPYTASPQTQYARDRYPENAPSYTPAYGHSHTHSHTWPGQYRGPPEIVTTFEPVDSKVGVIDHGHGGGLENGKIDETQLSVHRLPPTPNSANPTSPSNGPSPKLSITNNLLNPSEEGRNTLTLPPLSRMGEAGSPISSSGRKSPNGEGLPTEDARQLDGLGRRVF